MNNEQHQNTQTSAAPAIPSPFQKKTCWHALTGVSILVMLGIAAFVIFEVVELLGFLEPVPRPPHVSKNARREVMRALCDARLNLNIQSIEPCQTET